MFNLQPSLTAFIAILGENAKRLRENSFLIWSLAYSIIIRIIRLLLFLLLPATTSRAPYSEKFVIFC